MPPSNLAAAARASRGQQRNAERTVLAALVQSFIMFAVKQGLDPREVCAAAAVPSEALVDADRQVPHAWFFAIRRAIIERLPELHVGIELGTFVTPDQMGYVGLAIKHSTRGIDMLQSYARGLRLVDSIYETYPIQFAVETDQVRVGVHADALGPPDPPECVEALGVSTVFALRALTGLPVVPRSVRFAHERDAPAQRALETFFGCRVEFDQPLHEFTIDRAAMEAPCIHADEAASRHFDAQVLRLLGERALPFVTHVEREIALRLTRGNFSQECVAASLGLSVRALQRRLKAHELSYQELLSKVRERLAEGLLARPTPPIYEVAFALGYDDVSSFNRAFRAWKGLAPQEYRDRLRGS